VRRGALPALLLAGAAFAAPALAVGLGPLVKTGVTDGPAKAFYLTVINPYPTAQAFRAYAVGFEDEVPAGRVKIAPADITIGGRKSRRILVIANEMTPGESYPFRVCAERRVKQEGTIHARVCSKLTARRLPGAAGRPGAGQ